VASAADFAFYDCGAGPEPDCNQAVEITEADECRLVKVDGLPSVGPGGELEDADFIWSLAPTPDFADPDATGISFLYAWQNSTAGGAPTPFPVSLKVVDPDTGAFATKTETITINDLGPTTPSIVGPTKVAVGQTACYAAGASSACDVLTSFFWNFEYTSIPPTFAPQLIGEQAIEGVEYCYQWNAANSYVVGLQVVDSDGSTAEAYLSVEVTAENPPYQEQAFDLAVETSYHAYDPIATGGMIRHRAQVRVVNAGEAEVRGPIYVAFENLMPTGTELV
jgi:hypothetical protein